MKGDVGPGNCSLCLGPTKDRCHGRPRASLLREGGQGNYTTGEGHPGDP